MKPYQKLQRFWIDTNAHVPTVTLDERDVAILEAKYRIRLPADFREYLLQSCPRDDTAMDNNGTDWWPITRIKTVAEEYPNLIKNPAVTANSGKFLFFADFLIWSWAWAIACGEDDNHGHVVVINGVDDRFVANSFVEFVERYVQDVSQLAGGGEPV